MILVANPLDPSPTIGSHRRVGGRVGCSPSRAVGSRALGSAWGHTDRTTPRGSIPCRPASGSGTGPMRLPLPCSFAGLHEGCRPPPHDAKGLLCCAHTGSCTTRLSARSVALTSPASIATWTSCASNRSVMTWVSRALVTPGLALSQLAASQTPACNQRDKADSDRHESGCSSRRSAWRRSASLGSDLLTCVAFT